MHKWIHLCRFGQFACYLNALGIYPELYYVLMIKWFSIQISVHLVRLVSINLRQDSRVVSLVRLDIPVPGLVIDVLFVLPTHTRLLVVS